MIAAAAKPPVTAAAFAPDGQSVVTGSQDGLRVRAWPTLDLVETLPTQLVHVHDLSFSPDGKYLAAAGGAPSEEGLIEIFRWPERKLLRRIRSHEDLAYGVAWRSDSAVFATAGLDGKVALFDMAGGELIKTLTGHSRGVTSVVFVTDDVLVSAGLDQTLRVWDLLSGRVARTLDNHTRPLHDLALRPAQNENALPMLASVGDDRTVRLWQPTIGRMVRFVRLAQATPLAVRWSVDGGELLVACSDGHIRRIDPDAAKVVQEIATGGDWSYTLAIHPSGKEAAVGGREGKLVRVRLSASDR
jgi:WD40 repeat protein